MIESFDSVQPLFIVPVMLCEIQDTSFLKELEDTCLALEYKTEIHPGWRDPANTTMLTVQKEELLTYPIFQRLKEFLDIKVKDYVHSIGGVSEGLNIFNLWFNVYDDGQSQEFHTHGKSPVSGVVHVTSNPEQHTMFINPLLHHVVPAVENGITRVNAAYSTKSGNVIMFPGELFHGTSVNDNTGKRITIAFNYMYYDPNDESIK
jgi:uncharacterized protein (TIGR02466 family)